MSRLRAELEKSRGHTAEVEKSAAEENSSEMKRFGSSRSTLGSPSLA